MCRCADAMTRKDPLVTSLQEQGSGKQAGRLTRRRFLTGAAGIAALALAACGGAASPTVAPAVAPTARPSTAASAAPSSSAVAAAVAGAAAASAPAAAATASRVATAAASGTPRATVALPAPSGFPATVTHQYGTTEIKAAPQRVVSVGYTDQDFDPGPRRGADRDVALVRGAAEGGRPVGGAVAGSEPAARSSRRPTSISRAC